MAKIRSTMTTTRTAPQPMTADELRRASKFMLRAEGEPLPKVPAHLRSTGPAALEADVRCLRGLSVNEGIRAASAALAGNSSLGAWH